MSSKNKQADKSADTSAEPTPEQIAADAAEAARLQAESDRLMNEAAATDTNAATPAGTPVHTPATAPHSNLKFTRVKSVAVPLFKLAADQSRFFLVEGAMFVGKKIDDKKEAAILMPVTDLQTGEIGQIIIGQVLRELLIEQYPGDSYVGKRFEICLRKRADKKYNTYDLFEVAAAES